MLGLNPWTVALDEADRVWLGEFLESWQLLADLSFSDLVCWIPDTDGSTMVAVAQIRPATGATALPGDVVGELLTDVDSPVAVAYRTQRPVQERYATPIDHGDGIPVDVVAIPVVRRGRRIAVVARITNRLAMRTSGPLEQSYADAAKVLEEMLAVGGFPNIAEDPEPSHSPAVGDGVIRVDRAGMVVYASPNAQTAFRHLGLTGQFEGERFAMMVNALGRDRGPIDEIPVDSRPGALLVARVFDVHSDRATVRLRVVPLHSHEDHGALVLSRDITDLRARERQLVTKDATIREIHHRVKNNLQTVSALLRMQSRRVEAPEARIALAKAEQRIATIGVVHELLGQSHDDVVAYDEICDKLLALVGRVMPTMGRVELVRDGSFGEIGGDVATPLSLILNELCHNAVEHGVGASGGEVVVCVRRRAGRMHIDVENPGGAHPEETDLSSSSGLGLNIVQTLVADLQGEFSLTVTEAGAVAHVEIPLERILP